MIPDLESSNNDPIEMISPVYQGLTCQPTMYPTNGCTLGGYPASHQLCALYGGVRLIVKNTGHDFSGRSGGAGALSIWTHYLKGIDYIPRYSSSGTSWTGAAFRVGAGVQAYELYKIANEHKMMVVGGEGQVCTLRSNMLK